MHEGQGRIWGIIMQLFEIGPKVLESTYAIVISVRDGKVITWDFHVALITAQR